MEAERDSSDKNTDRVAAIEAQVERMKDLRKLAEVRYQAGQATQADVLGADFYIAEARLWQAQMKTD